MASSPPVSYSRVPPYTTKPDLGSQASLMSSPPLYDASDSHNSNSRSYLPACLRIALWLGHATLLTICTIMLVQMARLNTSTEAGTTLLILLSRC